MILSLSGYAGAGKDTFAAFLIQDFGFKRYAFADTLRTALEILDPGVVAWGQYTSLRRLVRTYGWEVVKRDHPEVRKMLQVLGTEVGRELLGEDIWVEATFKKIKAEGAERVVITDCRFPNELAWVKVSKGSSVWIDRPGTGAVNGHSSESALAGIDFDYTFINDAQSLTEMRQRVSEFVVTNLGI